MPRGNNRHRLAPTGGFRVSLSRARLHALIILLRFEVDEMDSSFLKVQAERCRSLAEKADRFTKRRLLDLAAKYDDRAGGPSRAVRTLGIPGSVMEAWLPETPDSAP